MSVVSYIRDRLHGHSWWDGDAGRVRFAADGVSTSPDDFAELAAQTATEAQQLQRILRTHDCSRAETLEIGCGFGRLTPWLDRAVGDFHAIDAESALVERAQRLHPSLDIREARADDLPHADSSIDCALTYTVLQHIPPDQLPAAVAEIERVVGAEGTLIITEETHPDRAGDVCWPRSVEAYEQLFDEFELVATESRETGAAGPAEAGTVMVFKR